jgi:hypothetical protein
MDQMTENERVKRMRENGEDEREWGGRMREDEIEWRQCCGEE